MATPRPRPLPFSNGLLPARLLRRQLQHRGVPRMLLEQREAKRDGSCPAASASSSIITSFENAMCEWPTERHQSTGTPTFGFVQVTCALSMLVLLRRAAFDGSGIDTVFHHRLERRADDEDWPTTRC